MNKLLIITPLALLFLVGCAKRKQRNDPTAKDIATAEAYFGDLQSISDDASDGNMGFYKSKTKNNCATITIDTSSSTNAIVVDYGSTNCACLDGKDRRGELVIMYTGAYRDSGTVITITPNDYYVNDHKLEGSHVVTNEGHNAAGNIWYSVDIDGTVIRPNGEEIVYNSDRVREWVAGESSVWNIFDDVYNITGTAQGTNSDGSGYTMEVITPLEIQIGCGFIKSGVLEIVPTDFDMITVDFGPGDCDADFSYTINGNTYDVNYN